MKTCVYDNPATMQREAWQNGALIAAVSATLLCEAGFSGHPQLFFGLNVGEWKRGQVIGDREAAACS